MTWPTLSVAMYRRYPPPSAFTIVHTLSAGGSRFGIVPLRRFYSNEVNQSNPPSDRVSFSKLSMFPVVRDDTEFWDTIEECAQQVRSREQAKLEKPSAPLPLPSSSLQYCPICFRYKHDRNVDKELLLHFAENPTHLVDMMRYDHHYKSTYFANVLHFTPPVSLCEK